MNDVQPLILMPGDLFVVNSESMLAGAINLVQKIKSWDNQSKYNHAGIILDENGNTLESLFKIDHYHLNHYRGKEIMIVRHCGMNAERFNRGLNAVMKYHGKLYPFWRLPLHLIGIAKYIHWSFPVCSELDGRFLYGAGLEKTTGWGVNPDNLADKWIESINYHRVLISDSFGGI